MPERITGKVKFFYNHKGCGFIERPCEPDVFFHSNFLRNAQPFPVFIRRQEVEFFIECTERSLEARDLIRLNGSGDLSTMPQYRPRNSGDRGLWVSILKTEFGIGPTVGHKCVDLAGGLAVFGTAYACDALCLMVGAAQNTLPLKQQAQNCVDRHMQWWKALGGKFQRNLTPHQVLAAWTTMRLLDRTPFLPDEIGQCEYGKILSVISKTLPLFAKKMFD